MCIKCMKKDTSSHFVSTVPIEHRISKPFGGGLNINPFNYGIIGYNNVKVTCRKLPGFIMSITYSMDMFSSCNLWEHRVCIGLKRYARERF